MQTKTEQQCRTRGLILFNKLQKDNWDPELKLILTPHTGNLFEDTQKKKREDKANAKE